MIPYILQIADQKITSAVPVCKHIFEVNNEDTKTKLVGIKVVPSLLSLNKCLSTGMPTFLSVSFQKNFIYLGTLSFVLPNKVLLDKMYQVNKITGFVRPVRREKSAYDSASRKKASPKKMGKLAATLSYF